MPARADPALLEARGRDLAEVVAERGQHDRELARAVFRQIGAERRRLVDDLQRVDPHVAFGVPARVLGSRLQRQQLGREDGQHPPRLQEREAARRLPGLQQQLLDLAEDALRRQLADRHRRAQRRGGRLDLELVARRELDGPQSAQRVVAERARVHGAQHARVEIAPAVPGIEQLVARRVVEHRVDREVAATGGLLDRERRVALDQDAAVAGAGLRVAPRQRHVDGARDAGDAGELEDAKGLAHGVDLPSRGENALETVQRRGRRPRRRSPSPAGRGGRRAPPRPPRRAVPRRHAARPCRSRRPAGRSSFMGLRQPSTSERTPLPGRAPIDAPPLQETLPRDPEKP